MLSTSKHLWNIWFMPCCLDETVSGTKRWGNGPLFRQWHCRTAGTRQRGELKICNIINTYNSGLLVGTTNLQGKALAMMETKCLHLQRGQRFPHSPGKVCWSFPLPASLLISPDITLNLLPVNCIPIWHYQKTGSIVHSSTWSPPLYEDFTSLQSHTNGHSGTSRRSCVTSPCD